jgi:hypothetical protein
MYNVDATPPKSFLLSSRATCIIAATKNYEIVFDSSKIDELLEQIDVLMNKEPETIYIEVPCELDHELAQPDFVAVQYVEYLPSDELLGPQRIEAHAAIDYYHHPWQVDASSYYTIPEERRLTEKVDTVPLNNDKAVPAPFRQDAVLAYTMWDEFYISAISVTVNWVFVKVLGPNLIEVISVDGYLLISAQSFEISYFVA